MDAGRIQHDPDLEQRPADIPVPPSSTIATPASGAPRPTTNGTRSWLAGSVI
jgi:hypothetical protein